MRARLTLERRSSAVMGVAGAECCGAAAAVREE